MGYLSRYSLITPRVYPRRDVENACLCQYSLSEGNKVVLVQLHRAGLCSNIKTCGGFIRAQGPTSK